jgi:hypothetical protein
MVTLFTTRRPDAEVRQHFNELRTIASIDQQVDDWHAAQPDPPAPIIIIEHPIEPGDSQLLGGAMEIKAPWKRD